MSDKLGPRVFGHDHVPVRSSTASSAPSRTTPGRDRAGDRPQEIRRIVESAHTVARDLSPKQLRSVAQPDLRDPARPRDDRARPVRVAAQRRQRGGGVRARRLHAPPQLPMPPATPERTADDPEAVPAAGLRWRHRRIASTRNSAAAGLAPPPRRPGPGTRSCCWSRWGLLLAFTVFGIAAADPVASKAIYGRAGQRLGIERVHEHLRRTVGSDALGGWRCRDRHRPDDLCCWAGCCG